MSAGFSSGFSAGFSAGFSWVSQLQRTMQVRLSVPLVTVMMAVPGATAVTVPFSATVATFGSELTNVHLSGAPVALS